GTTRNHGGLGMAITSEIIGKLGGGDIETVAVNRLIKQGESFQVLHTITVDRPSLVAATLTHDNTDSFSCVNGRAALTFRSAEDVYYGGSYGVPLAAGKPISIAAELSTGTWKIEAICNNGSGTSQYTAETLTITTVKM